MSPRWGARADDGAWRFGLWAPDAGQVDLMLEGRPLPMQAAEGGWWQLRTDAPEGAEYRFRLNGTTYPDPASRLQAGDVHGPSRLMASKPAPRGPVRDWAASVIYEMHVGTFTPEGTLAAAAGRMAHLADLGFTAIELMPLGQWSGDRGWGYDGVLPFAPHPAYGTPDDLRDLVIAAHDAGMTVILDLVMNHFGPEGAYLHATSPAFFDAGRMTPWGAAIDFAQPAVREFWIDCACHWVSEYAIDGLRLDAVHQIAGPGARDFMRDLSAELHRIAPVHLITEDERNEPDLRENCGYDASWNDDFHHAVHVALTAEDHAYYTPFAVDPVGDLALALKRGHVEEGQPRPPRDGLRGASCGHLPVTGFVNSVQTHDQVGNRAFGDRLLAIADPAGVAVAYALLLTAPYIPMVFMGEERGATSPFLFFADFTGDLAQAVRKGRAAEFPEVASHGDTVPDPLSPRTFAQSKLDWTDGPKAREWQDLTRRALRFRRDHVLPLIQSGRLSADVARTGDRALLADWRFAAGRLRIALTMGQAGGDPLPGAQFGLGHIGRDAFAISAKVDPA
ncbi:malto-oligosyltrehalose trehalohydrolase [Paracoccus sp. 1_MG-2023]|uniref:malto-oligosyltrehalose trehalohydrolase n=1 Tax=unclassified Paracoccus (in: a-proteobacteria) TaxID=2688777 RepID=UPI002090B000|nr:MULTISPECIES: malto-oligosyltrehalose trehalohydrolase [unclassified Paracoccus (in: a-proteobacteria)]MDO6669488.1 malto-oligosyltrehalose trehalohydrolase [Paracoccus sp. 1_MG-2023]